MSQSYPQKGRLGNPVQLECPVCRDGHLHPLSGDVVQPEIAVHVSRDHVIRRDVSTGLSCIVATFCCESGHVHRVVWKYIRGRIFLDVLRCDDLDPSIPLRGLRRAS